VIAAGRPSATALDEEETMVCSEPSGVKPRVEVFPLATAGDALAKTLENRLRVRAAIAP
jgi:hypothetical protein